MEARLVIAYHDTGYPEAYRILSRLVKASNRVLGVRVAAIPLTMLTSTLRVNDLIYALLLTSGKHYQEVRRAAKLRGAVVIGRIPSRLTLTYFIVKAVKAIEALDCTPLYCYSRAGGEVHALAARASELVGVNLYPWPGRGGGRCIAVSALPLEPPRGCRLVGGGVVSDMFDQLLDSLRVLVDYAVGSS